MLGYWVEGGWGSGSSCLGGRLDTWEGGWDSGSSCWTLGREAGIVDLHIGHMGGRLVDLHVGHSRAAGIVDLHVGQLGRRLGWWIFFDVGKEAGRLGRRLG